MSTHFLVKSLELKTGIGGHVDLPGERVVLEGQQFQHLEVCQSTEGQGEYGRLALLVGLLDAFQDGAGVRLADRGVAVGQEEDQGLRLLPEGDRVADDAQGLEQRLVDVRVA